MKKILFCQFHNYIINGKNKKDISDIYYTGIYNYKRKDGYYKTKEFFELPLWINEVKGGLKNHNFKTDLLVIDNLKNAIDKINTINPDYILFSVLDVNKKFIYDIIAKYKGKAKIILGGYIDFTDFLKFDNVKIFNSVKDFISFLNIPYVYNLDYSLFKNYKTIPRLTLSKGCINRCKFCIVTKKLQVVNKRDIIKQIKSFKNLKFKLIYLNDKTFGQVKNYKLLPLIYKRVKKYNSDFEGFIIQTTPAQVLNPDFMQFLKNSKIIICELGMETYNNNLLKFYKKPATIDIINKAIKILKNNDIKIILNIIIGLLGENKKTYNNTLSFIKKNQKDIYLLNIYNLAVYLNSELSKIIAIKNNNDLNENKTQKSFYNKKQVKNSKYFYNNLFKIAIKILKNKKRV